MTEATETSWGLILGLTVGVTVTVALIYAIVQFSSLFSTTPPCEDPQTMASLESIISTINSLESEAKKEILQLKKGCTLVPFSKGFIPPNQKINYPEQCQDKTCLCLCSGTNKESCLIKPNCKVLNFDKINLSGFKFATVGGEFEVTDYVPSYEDRIEDIALKKEDNSLLICGKDSPKCLGEGVLIEKGYIHEVILSLENTKSNIELYKDAIQKAHDAYPDVPISLIQAVIAQESGGRYDAVSPCGAVGLMQLMPGTAKENGMKTTFEDSSSISCNQDYARRLQAKRTEIKNSNFDAEQMKSQLIIIDERFDPEKNILISTAYLSKLLKDPSTSVDVKLVAAAYNGGTCNQEQTKGALCQSKSCPGKRFFECELNERYQQTRDYVTKVVAYNQEFAAVA